MKVHYFTILSFSDTPGLTMTYNVRFKNIALTEENEEKIINKLIENHAESLKKLAQTHSEPETAKVYLWKEKNGKKERICQIYPAPN